MNWRKIFTDKVLPDMMYFLPYIFWSWEIETKNRRDEYCEECEYYYWNRIFTYEVIPHMMDYVKYKIHKNYKDYWSDSDSEHSEYEYTYSDYDEPSWDESDRCRECGECCGAILCSACRREL